MKRYKISLSRSERQELASLLKKGTHLSSKLKRAQVLLSCDQGPDGPGWTDQQAHEAYGMSTRQIERLRKRLVEEGFAMALSGVKRRGRIPKLDGEAQAHLVALCCSEPPEGRSSWTLRLLADQMVALEYVQSISHEAIRQALKKRA